MERIVEALNWAGGQRTVEEARSDGPEDTDVCGVIDRATVAGSWTVVSLLDSVEQAGSIARG